MPIAWDEGVPSDSEQFSGFPARVKSFKTSFAQAISQSLFWPGSGGGDVASAGSVKPGTARASYGTQAGYVTPSSVSSGQAYITSDTSRFFGGGSSLTQFLGSGRMVENASFTSDHRTVWAFSSDFTTFVDNTGSLGAGDSRTARIFYSGTPFASGPTVIEVSVYANTSIGTGTLTGVAASLTASSATQLLILLQALSRTTSFPTGTSVTTLTVFAKSHGTVAV